MSFDCAHELRADLRLIDINHKCDVGELCTHILDGATIADN